MLLLVGVNMVTRLTIILSSLLLVGVLLAGCTGQRLATSPLDVYEKVHAGMTLDEVYDAIDPSYGGESCYIVSCESITISPRVNFIPTHDITTNYFLWVFMPRFSNAQPTVVCFRYNSTTDENRVIACERFDYNVIEPVLLMYGSSVFW